MRNIQQLYKNSKSKSIPSIHLISVTVVLNSPVQQSKSFMIFHDTEDKPSACRADTKRDRTGREMQGW